MIYEEENIYTHTFCTLSKLRAKTNADGKFLAIDKLRRRQSPSKY